MDFTEEQLINLIGTFSEHNITIPEQDIGNFINNNLKNDLRSLPITTFYPNLISTTNMDSDENLYWKMFFYGVMDLNKRSFGLIRHYACKLMDKNTPEKKAVSKMFKKLSEKSILLEELAKNNRIIGIGKIQENDIYTGKRFWYEKPIILAANRDSDLINSWEEKNEQCYKERGIYLFRKKISTQKYDDMQVN